MWCPKECGAPPTWGTTSPTTGHHPVGPRYEGLPISWVHYSEVKGAGLPASRPARLPPITGGGGERGPWAPHEEHPNEGHQWGIPRTIEQTEGEEKGVGGPVRPPTPPAGGFSVCAAGTPPLTLRLLFWWSVVCGRCWVGWVVGFFSLGGGWVVDFGFLCVYYWGVGGRCSCWVALGCLVGRSRSDISDLEVLEPCVA